MAVRGVDRDVGRFNLNAFYEMMWISVLSFYLVGHGHG
jgi:hypothetical protein